jgi:hypothetical protein
MVLRVLLQGWLWATWPAHVAQAGVGLAQMVQCTFLRAWMK